MSMSDRIFGTYTTNNKAAIKRKVNEVLALEDKYKNYTEEDFKKATEEFRKRIESGESLNDIMIEAFAVCRAATKLTLNMAHYPVQIEAAIAMQDGAITEMKTGEGKTLVQILTSYLNAISGLGVHVITSNDYLAERDSIQNGKVYECLGLSCGFVAGTPKMSRDERRVQYKKDIVYSTASTIGFDYLDDNKVMKVSERVFNRPLHYAIIDEVDSILLDDARVPLIKTGKAPASKKTEYVENYTATLYKWATDFLNNHNIRCHVEEQEKSRSSENLAFREECLLFKDTGKVIFSERLYDLILEGKSYDENDSEMQAMYNEKCVAIQNCILAREMYKNGKQYQVLPSKDTRTGKIKIDPVTKKPLKEIVLVGAGTGRLLYGRRYSSGIHEALEAKEEALEEAKGGEFIIPIKKPSVTTATCTYPNLLSKYTAGICGMTGTSNNQEFIDIYGLPTYEVPSRKPNIRKDLTDEVYVTKKDKYKAIVDDIIKCRERLQPVLIGTTSVEESQIISDLLKEAGIRHQLLNAVKSENEAGIISNAGQLGKITVATNMAGRGTDIPLGHGVAEVGGLYVIGTSRNNSERVDNQLRGRAGRQGDPGQTKFYSSLEDEIVTLRCQDRLKDALTGLGKESGPVKSKFIASQVDKCQESQEGLDQSARIDSEKYGSVLSSESKQINEERNLVLESNDIASLLETIIDNYSEVLVDSSNFDEIEAKIGHLINTKELEGIKKKSDIKSAINKQLIAKLKSVAKNHEYEEITKTKMLNVIDTYWISQLDYLSEAKTNSGFSAMAQKDPLQEYIYDAATQFNAMFSYIQNELITYALNPKLEFGDYQVQEAQNVESSQILL